MLHKHTKKASLFQKSDSQDLCALGEISSIILRERVGKWVEVLPLHYVLVFSAYKAFEVGGPGKKCGIKRKYFGISWFPVKNTVTSALPSTPRKCTCSAWVHCSPYSAHLIRSEPTAISLPFHTILSCLISIQYYEYNFW